MFIEKDERKMKFKKVIAMMAVILTLAASAPTVFATTESTGRISQTQIAVDDEDVKSEENILIETDLETGEEKEVVVEPGQDPNYYSPGSTAVVDLYPTPGFDSLGNTEQLEATTDIYKSYQPEKTICYLSVTYSNGDSYPGTGFIVGKNTVVTAGHCLHDAKLGKAIRVTVIPGRKKVEDAPYGTFSTTKIAVPNKWANNQDPKYDYGIITVNSDIVSAVGESKWGYRATSGNELLGTRRRGQGYPENLQDQYFISGQVTQAGDAFVYLEKLATRGMSGSPLFESTSGMVAEGILTAGVGTETRFVRITKEIYDAISLYAK